VELDRYYVIKPDFPQLHEETSNWREGRPVPEDFCYASNTNPVWLTRDQLRCLVEQVGNELELVAEG
jgi:hypothetical protein